MTYRDVLSTLGLVKNKNVVFSKNEILIKCANLTRLDYITFILMTIKKWWQFFYFVRHETEKQSNERKESLKVFLPHNVVI